jgi:DNA-directed RNA polymerase specialized sigma24 family protein
MSIQDPATHVRARQSAAFRYEAARRQLAKSLQRRLPAEYSRDTPQLKLQRLRAESQADTPQLSVPEQRQLVVEHATNLLVPLSRFIMSEIQHQTDLGMVEEGLVDVEDILAATVVATAERAGAEGMPAALYPWLRRIAREQVQASVVAEAERSEVERSLDAPVKIAGEEWPDRAVLLKDVLADPNSLLPEEILEHRETWALLEHAIARLPERWREIFLLRTVDAWDDDEIALAEGVTVEEIELINLSSRAFLREYLQDSPLAGAG